MYVLVCHTFAPLQVVGFVCVDVIGYGFLCKHSYEGRLMLSKTRIAVETTKPIVITISPILDVPLSFLNVTP